MLQGFAAVYKRLSSGGELIGVWSIYKPSTGLLVVGKIKKHYGLRVRGIMIPSVCTSDFVGPLRGS